jgi:ABC-type amino acid transport substrate-binding protein
MFMRVRYSLLWSAAATGILAGCSSTPTPKPVAADPTILRVGVSPTSAPMVFKQGEQIVGVEADLAQALGRELGRRVVFVEEKWENLIDALTQNQIDIIMSSMSITPARQYRIAFSNPYLRVNQLALCRDEDKYAYVINVGTQAKRGFGLKAGTTADFLVRQELPQVERKYYTTGEEAAEALVKKDIDLFLSDSPMIWYLAGVYETKGLVVVTLPVALHAEELAWGIRRADTAFTDAVNSYLKKAQTSGELTRTYSKWMPGFR